MIQLIVSAALAIIFFLLFWKIDIVNDEFWAAGAFTGFICTGIWFVICLIMCGVSNNDWCSEQAKIQYIEKRKAIVYCMTQDPNSVRSLASDISDYNAQVLKGRRLNSNPWFNLETYDFWDELELIEVGNDKEEKE